MKTRIRTVSLILVLLAAVPLTLVALPSCGAEAKEHRKVIVLGFDGTDARLCTRMMDAGELPNLAKLRAAGGYSALGTSIPPQSPVAWATFITGCNPGVHGIFDFIHRDPAKQYYPYYSAADTHDPKEGWDVGDYRIPLTFWPFNHEPPETVLLRKGIPFWDALDEAEIPVWLYDIPANYPPDASKTGNLRCLAGMGVTDLLGGYGTYQFFSKNTRQTRAEAGGMRAPLRFTDNTATAKIVGPPNTLLKTPKDTYVEFRIHRHPSDARARIELPDQTIMLREGEWSDWCTVEFELEMPSFLPNESITGICRFYLQQVRPDFRLYVTPINIDPRAPGEQKITEPADFITEISDELGLFYTSGFQEDHKALSNGVFTDEDYREQAGYVLKERLNLFDYALEHYKDGFLFFYYSSTDLQAHMFWWDSDQPHPTRSAIDAQKYNEVIKGIYREMDEIVGRVMERYGDEATVLVMSDHGFCNFKRQFNVNTWLRDNGYIQPADCDSLVYSRTGREVDWQPHEGLRAGTQRVIPQPARPRARRHRRSGRSRRTARRAVRQAADRPRPGDRGAGHRQGVPHGQGLLW